VQLTIWVFDDIGFWILNRTGRRRISSMGDVIYWVPLYNLVCQSSPLFFFSASFACCTALMPLLRVCRPLSQYTIDRGRAKEPSSCVLYISHLMLLRRCDKMPQLANDWWCRHFFSIDIGADCCPLFDDPCQLNFHNGYGIQAKIHLQ